jgi:hypothetical protein
MKKKLPPKKKLPFYSRVSGNAAQRRPDRKAPPERELRRVFNKADADLIDPFKPPAPPGGGETQQFVGDKPVPRPPGPRLKKGGAVKRQQGGDVPLPKPDPRYNIGEGEDLPAGVAKTWNKQMGTVRGIERGDKQPWDTRPGSKGSR